MKAVMKKNVFMFAGLFIAALSLVASWGLQQASAVIRMDTMESLVVSGVLSAVALLMATLVGVGLAARRD